MGTNSSGKRAMAAAPAGTANKDDTRRYRGVRCRPWGRYSAEIRCPQYKEKRYLGTLDTAELAALAYDIVNIAMRGHKAKTNFRFPSAMQHGHVAAGDWTWPTMPTAPWPPPLNPLILHGLLNPSSHPSAMQHGHVAEGDWTWPTMPTAPWPPPLNPLILRGLLNPSSQTCNAGNCTSDAAIPLLNHAGASNIPTAIPIPAGGTLECAYASCTPTEPSLLFPICYTANLY